MAVDNDILQGTNSSNPLLYALVELSGPVAGRYVCAP